MKNLPRRRVAIEIFLDDSPPLHRRVKTVLLANMGKITGGLAALPTAVSDDGLLDIGLIKAETLAHWAHLMGSALLGHPQRDPKMEVHQARRVTLKMRRPQPVQFDGEGAGRIRELTVEIVPRAVQILLPKNAPAVESRGNASPAAVAEQTARRRLRLPLILLALVGVLLWWQRRRAR